MWELLTDQELEAALEALGVQHLAVATARALLQESRTEARAA